MLSVLKGDQVVFGGIGGIGGDPPKTTGECVRSVSTPRWLALATARHRVGGFS